MQTCRKTHRYTLEHLLLWILRETALNTPHSIISPKMATTKLKSHFSYFNCSRRMTMTDRWKLENCVPVHTTSLIEEAEPKSQTSLSLLKAHSRRSYHGNIVHASIGPNNQRTHKHRRRREEKKLSVVHFLLGDTQNAISKQHNCTKLKTNASATTNAKITAKSPPI